MQQRREKDRRKEPNPKQPFCRYGIRCVRPDCYFQHPNGREFVSGVQEWQGRTAVARERKTYLDNTTKTPARNDKKSNGFSKGNGAASTSSQREKDRVGGMDDFESSELYDSEEEIHTERLVRVGSLTVKDVGKSYAEMVAGKKDEVIIMAPSTPTITVSSPALWGKHPSPSFEPEPIPIIERSPSRSPTRSPLIGAEMTVGYGVVGRTNFTPPSAISSPADNAPKSWDGLTTRSLRINASPPVVVGDKPGWDGMSSRSPMQSLGIESLQLDMNSAKAEEKAILLRQRTTLIGGRVSLEQRRQTLGRELQPLLDERSALEEQMAILMHTLNPLLEEQTLLEQQRTSLAEQLLQVERRMTEIEQHK